MKKRNEKDIPEIVIQFVPETQIIAPLVTRYQLERWIKKGWMEEEDIHLDRAFPRNAEGKAILLKMWLLAPMKRAIQNTEISREKALNFDIVDDKGFPVNYIVIPDKPLKYRRMIMDKNSTEYYEYIDATFDIVFRVRTKYPKEFVQALSLAGNIGMMRGTKYGYGKFRITIKQ